MTTREIKAWAWVFDDRDICASIQETGGVNDDGRVFMFVHRTKEEAEEAATPSGKWKLVPCTITYTT